MYMEGENKKRKTAIELDWEKLLPRQDDQPPPLLVVTTTAFAADQPQSTMWTGDGLNLHTIPDAKLDEFIARQRMTYETMASRTLDKGQKILAKLSSLEEEKERRKNRLGKKGNLMQDIDHHLSRFGQDDGGGEKPRQSHNPNFNGASRGFRQGAPSSLPHSRFGLNICQKMEENQTDCRTVNAFGKEYTATGHCDRRRRITLRQSTFQGPSFFSVDIDKRNVSNGARKGRNLFPGSPNVDKDLSSTLSKKDASKVHPSNNLRPRNGKTVVLVDEEEPQFVETVQHEEELNDCIKEIKICYPSRDDPESVEICYADMECLAPETYLSSTIMNFYIRYLQQPTSTTDRERCGYHFFTTYFYEKLKEAVLNKTSDKVFVKFRRWWKGVNIFEKAYIVLPIHEYQHWSLVIICIPDKEDESGPILLHLDSLGLHSSRSIFDNVKSFLKKEWSYLNQVEAFSHYPLVDRIWHNLPCRIDESKVMVPQQKNKYDCGLFVLFFMERFIEEAPHRLKKKDFAMFGKQWFNPKEASDLRLKIQSILVKKFKKESVDRSVLEP